jgi:hypothetical protein
VFTICAICYVISDVKCVVLSHQHFPKHVCSVQCGCFLYVLTSCLPALLLRYFLDNCETVPIDPIVTGITFCCTFHLPCISNVRSFYLKIFLTSFLITFPPHEIATSIHIHVSFSSLQIVISGLLLGMILLVFNLLTSQYGCLNFMACFY